MEQNPLYIQALNLYEYNIIHINDDTVIYKNDIAVFFP